MRIDFRDDDLIVFLNKRNISSIDFSNNVELEDYFKKLFLGLSNKYDIDFSGCYDIDVFLDKFYGAVIYIKKDDSYFEYYDSVDMNISVSKYCGFVYKVNDICKDFSSCNVYFYNDCFYLEPIDVDFYDIGFILESCEIIYGKDAYDVKLFGKISNCIC